MTEEFDPIESLVIQRQWRDTLARWHADPVMTPEEEARGRAIEQAGGVSTVRYFEFQSNADVEAFERGQEQLREMCARWRAEPCKVDE